MSYDYSKLFEKIIEVIGAEVSTTQRMLAVIEECSRQKPHPDWELLASINFEADGPAIRHWLSSAFETLEPKSVHGLWFGLVNLSDGNSTTADVYVGGSPNFDEEGIDWASEITSITELSYLNSIVLHDIYTIAYRTGTGHLGNDAEYPLALAYGAIAAIQALRDDGLLASNLSSVKGAASGFDSGDFLFLGAVEDGHFHTRIKAG